MRRLLLRPTCGSSRTAHGRQRPLAREHFINSSVLIFDRRGLSLFSRYPLTPNNSTLFRHLSTTHTTSTDDSSNKESPKKPQKSSPSSSSSSSLALYASLAKARLSALVVGTTAAGYLAAGPQLFDSYEFTACLVGTALCSSSAAAWNQIFEMNADAKMKRTQQRPLVTGELSKSNAIIVATSWGIAGPTLLYTCCGIVPAALGVANMVLYAGVYTALKPISITNTWVGAIVGAIPPVMGYAAATNNPVFLLMLDPIPVNLAALLYFWQLPHFMALSYMYRADYARGGFAMLPCRDEIQTANVMVRYSCYTAAVPIVAALANVTSVMFALEGLLLNGYAIAVAHRFRQDRTNQNARKVFLTSLWCLPCTLMLFLLHSKTWDEKHSLKEQQREDGDNIWMQRLSDQVQAIRRRGRELCLHETMAHDKASSCPVVMAEQTAEDAMETVTATDTAEDSVEN